MSDINFYWYSIIAITIIQRFDKKMTYFRTYNQFPTKFESFVIPHGGNRICSLVDYYQTIPNIKSIEMSYERAHCLIQSHEKSASKLLWPKTYPRFLTRWADSAPPCKIGFSKVVYKVVFMKFYWKITALKLRDC